MRRLIALGVVVLLAACADVATEPAADLAEPVFGENDAVVSHEDGQVQECVPANGHQFCGDYRLTLSSFETPSGDVKYTLRAHGATSVYYLGELLSTSIWKTQSSFLVEQGDTHVQAWAEQGTEEYPGLGTCTLLNRYQFANGKVTRYVDQYVCDWW